MKILGIDVGIRKTGWGLIKITGKTKKYLDYGLIKPDPKLTIEQRLCFLHINITAVIANSNPDQIGIEKTFVGLNPASGLILGAAFGSILTAIGMSKVPMCSYSTKIIKQIVAEKGNATKEEMASAVCKVLKIDIDQHDVTDAFGAALCHWESMQELTENSN
ncbi:crossover junction endodeoxyribonuclease RuvC [Candidatus Nesciobacter abundans]|uniref:crossover junction endodeoxyribonuclease n=1 Tax=Candidatus Nesciobacter abundans TaxID=2601668 RepID=A0A5C0UHP9_9PROT|nr:crossover junction endodeoxyribonuclease RuvC [Candidatus Nesciobacter abundans]QEK38882.1 crossover junction endodeoxyribonuclease RuvC [Candidatus Nesciobacter abundans]